jgi:hypothetical protein
MSLLAFSPQNEFDHCLERERVERAAAQDSADPAVKDLHILMAERYADQAWSISEQYDLPYAPSGLWR